MAIDPTKLKPGELVRLLNSTPLNEVSSERQVHRHRTRAGFRIAADGDVGRVNLFRYVAWMVNTRTEEAAAHAAGIQDEPAVQPLPLDSMVILGRLAAGQLTPGQIGLTESALRLAEQARRYEQEHGHWLPKEAFTQVWQRAMVQIRHLVEQMPARAAQRTAQMSGLSMEANPLRELFERVQERFAARLASNAAAGSPRRTGGAEARQRRRSARRSTVS